MKGYYHKIFLYVLGMLAIGTIIIMMNNGALVEVGGFDLDLELPDPIDTVPAEEMAAGRKTVLVLVDEEEEASINYRNNFERVLRWMGLEGEFVDIRRKDSVSYVDYDLVAVAFSDWDGLIGGEDSQRMLRYVEGGGRLFLGMMPYSPGVVYRTLYRAMGVSEYGNYQSIDGLAFKEELLAGSEGRQFVDETFADVALGVQIEEAASLYAVGMVGEREIPLAWKSTYGEGQILTYNATGITGDSWTGVLGGCLATLLDDYIYPVINTKTVFIDDFPSPIYNAESERIEEDYNRSVQEFFRDIWWPDMQAAAVRYDLDYVGLFIATYDDTVDPEEFYYIRDTVEQYYGNSLLDNGFEVGAHGFNHQPLVGEGETPETLGYNAWAGEADMTTSITEMREIAEDLFPGIKLYTYVPPSNYLNAEGRQAAVESLPDLQAISGVYTLGGEEGSVYVQDYRVAEDGIVEFPRATAGMLEDSYDDFTGMSVAGLYGVYSHFVHPDDILDPERNGGKDWESLFSDFCNKLNLINEYFAGLRPMTAAEAAQEVRVAEALEVSLTIEEGRATGRCNGFTGEGWCYLRTDKIPEADNESCEITPVCGDYPGSYYLVHILEPEFSFMLQ